MAQVMSQALGPCWKELFDLCLANSKKPLFQYSESPFYELQGEKLVVSKKFSLKAFADLFHEEKVFTEGNANLLTRYF